jgi:hypothetical protein
MLIEKGQVVMETLLGVFVVGLAGLIMGSGAWPYKLMRKFQFEHWWFIGNLVGLVIIPWTITLVGCPNAIEGLRAVPAAALIKANLFATGWGVANVLCGLCYLRIGMALTGAILAGLGVCVGTVVPMVFKGSGLFKNAADLGSPAGLVVLGGVAVMLIGVVLAALAGFGRDRELKKLHATCGGFAGGLIMTVIAGVLSAGMAFAFVYSQGPIIANLSIVRPDSAITVSVAGHNELPGKYDVRSDGTIQMNGVGAIAVGGMSALDAAHRVGERLVTGGAAGDPEVRIETGSIVPVFAVYAVGLFAGAVLNLAYAVYLLTRNRSWHVFTESWKEAGLALIIGINSSLAVVLVGKGMLLLGALGASVGWGIQQAMQMTGSQAVGFVSGEWRGVLGTPRRQMYLAIAILIIAAAIMAYGNTLAKV